jgi:magnesium transporter
VSRAHSNYLAHISIELTQSSNRTNDVVAKLTILASLIVPMNLVTGLWGMNVHVPGQEDASLVWFFSIVACFVWLGFLIFIWLRKSDVL